MRYSLREVTDSYKWTRLAIESLHREYLTGVKHDNEAELMSLYDKSIRHPFIIAGERDQISELEVSILSVQPLANLLASAVGLSSKPIKAYQVKRYLKQLYGNAKV